jgi:predicted DNA-binding antitoxin AbrB/MazE fold protein
MSQDIHAVFHDGVFHPLQPVDWPEGTRAQVTPLPESAALLGSRAQID